MPHRGCWAAAVAPALLLTGHLLYGALEVLDGAPSLIDTLSHCLGR